MDDFMILDIVQGSYDLIRATPLQSFIGDVGFVVNRLLYFIGSSNAYSLVTTIKNEPLLMFPIGAFALMSTIGLLKRFLSRD